LLNAYWDIITDLYLQDLRLVVMFLSFGYDGVWRCSSRTRPLVRSFEGVAMLWREMDTLEFIRSGGVVN